MRLKNKFYTRLAVNDPSWQFATVHMAIEDARREVELDGLTRYVVQVVRVVKPAEPVRPKTIVEDVE